MIITSFRRQQHLGALLLASWIFPSCGLSYRSSWSPGNSRLLSTKSDFDTVDAVEHRPIWLVVGDGDLSYSAGLILSKEKNVRLIASVFEGERAHRHVYRNSILNSEAIVGNGGELRFGVDATKLETIFPENSIQRIIFNFPHWRGKSNIKHNRKLVSDFLSSANKVLACNDDAQIRIALCESQGGAEATSVGEWKEVSWMVPAFAAANGLLLRNIKEFDPQYNLSSHRGTDRGFFVGSNPKVYVFGRPNGTPVKKEFQIAYRHELRLVLDPRKLNSICSTVDELSKGNVIANVLRTCVPDGISFEVASTEIVRPSPCHPSLLVILVVYAGEKFGISRMSADRIRAKVEIHATETLGLDIAKRGRLVSKSFPYRLLPDILK